MTQAPAGTGSRSGPLAAILSECRFALLGVAAFSLIGNVLMLTGSIYMMEVYDRVLPSRAIPTLIGLSVLAAVLYGFLGLFDALRGRLLVRVGAMLDERVGPRVFRATLAPLMPGAQALRDLDNIRAFIAGPGPAALCDLPWLPFYLAICFAFHPLLGLTALGGAIVLVALTLLTERLTGRPVLAAAEAGQSRNRLAEAAQRNAEMLRALGMRTTITGQWSALQDRHVAAHARASDVAGGIGAAVRVLRMLLQSSMLAVGALLVIRQEASAGIIIAGSIISGRALAPVDMAIANWKGFVAARQGWSRLTRLLAAAAEPETRLQLPPPHASVRLDAIAALPPGGSRPVLADVDVMLPAGTGLGVIGPSASGKSSLARVLVGAWAPARGAVRLDGADLAQWDAEELGRHIGYLPQDVELLAGTVAQNIARFTPDATDEAVIAAARAARVHELIVSLPDGYETQVGDGGSVLSAGQRQRVALARALYGDPFLVVLDEPNSNLDAEGEAALTQAILDVRARGGVAVVIAHRPSALAGVDMVLMLHQGRVLACGPKDEVLARVLRQNAAPGGPMTMKPVALASAQGGA